MLPEFSSLRLMAHPCSHELQIPRQSVDPLIPPRSQMLPAAGLGEPPWDLPGRWGAELDEASPGRAGDTRVRMCVHACVCAHALQEPVSSHLLTHMQSQWDHNAVPCVQTQLELPLVVFGKRAARRVSWPQPR